MNATQKENLNLELEKYVDAHGLKAVVEAIAEVSHDKAVHIAENWQDVALAKIWHMRGHLLSVAVSKFGEEFPYETARTYPPEQDGGE